MNSHILHTVWCNTSEEAAEEIWNWSLLGVKGLMSEEFFDYEQLIITSLLTKLGPRHLE